MMGIRSVLVALCYPCRWACSSRRHWPFSLAVACAQWDAGLGDWAARHPIPRRPIFWSTACIYKGENDIQYIYYIYIYMLQLYIRIYIEKYCFVYASHVCVCARGRGWEGFRCLLHSLLKVMNVKHILYKLKYTLNNK